MRDMVGGCCVCSDEQGWNENPLVYCDGQGCTVAVHQACYGIVSVPSGPWYCRKCESQERAARVRCELCPNKDGALKRTDNGGWAHVVCALYIPEVRFGNVATMEPIILALVPQERFNKVCYLCLEKPGKESKASHGACMQCNRPGCKDAFHVTCAQAAGLLCEEAGNYMDNVKYCGYCDHHFQKINKKLVKAIPAFRPTPALEEESPSASPDKSSFSSSTGGVKDPNKQYPSSCNSKGKGKRGRKPGSMIYEPKLEPPKFNPDLASLSNQSNNSLNSVNNSVTLTPVSNFNNINHKSVNSFSNSEGVKHDRNLNDKINNKTPNVVVKIGKHGEVHHAKKDSPHDNLTANTSPSESEAILERVTTNSEVKEEVVDKKGFTTANFTESFLPSSSVSVTASLIKHSDSEKHPNNSDNKIDTSRVKLESPETLDAPSSSSSSTPSSVSLVNVRKSDSQLRQQVGSGDLQSSDPAQITSHNSIPQYKGDLKTHTSTNNSNPASSHNTFTNTSESGKNNSSSSNCVSSNTTTTMYNRHSVSLFPTSTHPSAHHPPPANTHPHPPAQHSSSAKPDSSNSQPPQQSTVSIIPSVTSNCSSSVSLSSTSSSLTVTPVDSSSSGAGAVNMSNNAATKIQNNSESVTISSVANSDDRLTLETLNQSKNGAINSQNKVEKVGNGPVKRIGRPPKKGTHTTTSSLGNVINIDNSDEEDQAASASKRPRTEESEKVDEKAVKKEENENNSISKFMMFGASLNPSSGQAKELSTVLQNEVAAHSVYSGESSAQLVGVALPGRQRRPQDSGRSAPHTVAGMLDPARQPQTLEELLERHWEQGSRFLMEQASHFDIASLLSSLHQLKEENLGLEDSVDRLIARRDHLLAVRARLLALNSLTVNSFPAERGTREAGASLQNGPTTDRRLVSPVSQNRQALVSPSRDKTLPSPRDRGPPLPSPRDRRELQSPRDRERSPRLPVVSHLPMENGLDGHSVSLPPGYRQDRLSNAQLLSVAHQSNNVSNHRQHSPVSHPPPPKAHYSHNAGNLPPGHVHGPPGARGHVELRGNYPPTNYQMVSPPPPPKGHVAPAPAHSGSHLSSMSRSTPPGMRSTPPGPGGPPPSHHGPPGGPPTSHHGLPPEIHQHLMRASPQSTIHLKK